MSHASLLTWIPWEIQWAVAGLHMPGLPRRRPLDQMWASFWVFPGPGTAPLCGMSLVSVFNSFTDEHVGQASQLQTTLQFLLQAGKLLLGGVLKTNPIP